MTVARLSGSHNTLDWHRETSALIRAATPDVTILLDVSGRNIRTGQLALEPEFRRSERIALTTGASSRWITSRPA